MHPTEEIKEKKRIVVKDGLHAIYIYVVIQKFSSANWRKKRKIDLVLRPPAYREDRRLFFFHGKIRGVY